MAAIKLTVIGTLLPDGMEFPPTTINWYKFYEFKKEIKLYILQFINLNWKMHNECLWMAPAGDW